MRRGDGGKWVNVRARWKGGRQHSQPTGPAEREGREDLSGQRQPGGRIGERIRWDPICKIEEGVDRAPAFSPAVPLKVTPRNSVGWT